MRKAHLRKCMLDLRLHHVEDGARHHLLESHEGYEVGVGLADDEVIDVEHFRQLPEGQIVLERPIMPPPLHP